MFGRHHQGRRPTNIVFVIFRLILSMVMFTVLLAGVYTAYKHFSGLDPLKLDPAALLKNIPSARIPRIPSLNTQPVKTASSNPAFKFLVAADSHSDNDNLSKAISQGKQAYPDLKFIIGLGDYTEVGTVDELKNAKSRLDSSSLRYFLIPGDHDLWDCRNRSMPAVSCFNQVFGPNYQAFTFENFKFLLLDNSDNYTGLGEDQLDWLTSELEKAKEEKVKGIFVFLHEPLYHPSSEHVMGWVEKKLKFQAGELMFQLKDAGVTRVFAGDIHFFSEYSEPKTSLSMTTIGAVGVERNPQAPRFAIVSVFDDGKVVVEDMEIK